MNLKTHLELCGLAEFFEMGDLDMSCLKLDEDGDLWLFDFPQKTNFNLGRQGDGWVIIAEEWVSKDNLFRAVEIEYPNATLIAPKSILEEDPYYRVDLGTGLGESLYPIYEWDLIDIVNDILFKTP